ncbi:MAG: hypothetical protein ACOWWO_13580 [Peptococcaceae bacterium]
MAELDTYGNQKHNSLQDKKPREKINIAKQEMQKNPVNSSKEFPKTPRSGQSLLTGVTKGILKNVFPPQKPVKAYGLGAHLPPAENVEVNHPVTLEEEDEAVGYEAFPERVCNNNCFFEALFMQIIIFWLLKWLFSYD